MKARHRYQVSVYRTNGPLVIIEGCAAKLFNIILTKRLDDFSKDNTLINPVQIGFNLKARTNDHMFVLRPLIEKYTKDKCG